MRQTLSLFDLVIFGYSLLNSLSPTHVKTDDLRTALDLVGDCDRVYWKALIMQYGILFSLHVFIFHLFLPSLDPLICHGVLKFLDHPCDPLKIFDGFPGGFLGTLPLDLVVHPAIDLCPPEDPLHIVLGGCRLLLIVLFLVHY